MVAPCVVCLAPGNGKHFGVDACRGCTSFFRRSVVNKKQYKCSEDDSCDIENSEGLLCKKCRFEKCIKVGMKKEAIQKNRDIYGRRNPECKAIVAIPSTSSLQVTIPCTILSAIKKNYSQLKDVREVVHRMDAGSMFLKPAPRGQNYKETYRLLLREFYLVADWISNSFPYITELPTIQKDILLRNFYLTFYNLEAGYFACQRNRDDIWLLPNGNFINCQDLESFYHDECNQQPMTSSAAAKLFRGTCTTCKRNVLVPMLRENVSQFEFLALAALLLFDTGLEGQSDSCIDTCRKVRLSVQREMIQYYSHKRIEEYPLRMANILSLIPSVQKASQKMQSDLELGHLFNAYSAEKSFLENSEGLLCKKCRFEKCIKVGMKKEAIQKNRDIYGRRNPECKAIVAIPSTSSLQVTIPCTILSAIKKNYSQLKDVREVVHRMDAGSMFLKPAPRGQNYKETYRLLLREFYLVADWISNSFPYITELPTIQKDILLRNFYLTFYNLEAGYFACQRNRDDIWLLPNGNFINCQDLESFYHDECNQQPMTSSAAAKLFRGTCTTCKRNVLVPMLRENVSQFEFLALAALLLFDTGLEGQSDSCIDTCRKVRLSVQREMIQYYSHKRIEEYPLRMANILSLIPSKASQKMQSDLELGHLFNAYSAEKSFLENCMGKR